MSAERLTHARCRWLIRLLGLASLLLAAGGAMSWLAPLPPAPAANEAAVVRAAARLPAENVLLIPKYAELRAERATPFEFLALNRADVALRAPPDAPSADAPPVPPPAPAPDIDGLTLIGTAPAGAGGFAVLSDSRSGRLATVARGDTVRDAVVESIHAERIVLALGERRARIELVPVRGSDNLNRQLEGLAPLPGERRTTPSAPSPSPAPPASGTAVLAGVGGAPGPAYVITQASPMSGEMPTAGQPGGPSRPSGDDVPVAGDAGPEDPSRSGAASSGDGANADAPAAPRRSLGISGYMIGLDQQQELGLEQPGLLVSAVRVDGSPLAVGDVILSIDGQPFDSVGAAQTLIQGASSDTVQLQVFSDGAARSIGVNLSEG